MEGHLSWVEVIVELSLDGCDESLDSSRDEFTLLIRKCCLLMLEIAAGVGCEEVVGVSGP